MKTPSGLSTFSAANIAAAPQILRRSPKFLRRRFIEVILVVKEYVRLPALLENISVRLQLGATREKFCPMYKGEIEFGGYSSRFNTP
jgi:hypothetical protein